MGKREEVWREDGGERKKNRKRHQGGERKGSRAGKVGLRGGRGGGGGGRSEDILVLCST